MKTPCHLIAVSLFAAFTLSATADDNTPVIHRLIFPDSSIGLNISNNGRWVVANASTSVGDEEPVGHLYDVDADTAEDLPSRGTVNDVSDDGSIVVGSHNGRPAYWKRSDGKWHNISVPAGWAVGKFNAVTPDGRYAVGTFSDETLFYERGVMWDLEKNVEVKLTNLPKKNMLGTNSGEMRYIGISADGRYVLMTMDFAYVDPAELCSFVYDVQTQTYQTIGFTPNDNGNWEPHHPNTYFIDGPVMSPSGEWVTGTAYMVLDDNPDYPTQYNAVFRMNVLTGDYEVYDDGDGEYYAFAVSDDGVVYGSSPTTSPLRDWAVRYGNNWVPVALIAEQRYGVDFSTISTFTRTGTASAVSSDGKRILTIIDPTGESAVIDFNDPLRDICSGIDLLASYSVSPAPGSVFPRLTNVSVTFDQKVKIVGELNAAQVIDSQGNVKRSSNNMELGDNPMQVNITFRGTNLDAGEHYDVVIPAGTFAMANDATMTNSEIRISYTGRANEPVAVTEVYPINKGSLVKIDNIESPIQLTFNTDISVVNGKTGSLILVDDAGETTLCPLNLAAAGKMLFMAPSSVQYLYSGSHYKVVLPEGCVTDVIGYGPNEPVELEYEGRYVREITSSDATLFSCDFNNMAQSLATFLLYEGDHCSPNGEMASLGFDADNTPWNFSLRESNESTDFFAASHSLYDFTRSNLRSDDWMMVPQLYLPDDFCQLSFDAQRYHASANDRLKVLAWQCDDVINTLTPAIIERVKQEAVVIFDEEIPNGGTDDGIADEWQHYVVDMPQFSGKNVYIAFLNDNEQQSAVFLDNVSVTRNLKFLVSLSVPESVVGRPSQIISGTFIANSDTEPITSVSLVLRDGDGNEIEQVVADNLHLKKGDRQTFTFYEKLPLTIGREVPFSIDVLVNNLYHETIRSSVKDLAFSPTKRVVIEEMTGLDCGNCPLGIIAFEHLEQLYGDQVIPVSIHTYPGDPYGAGLAGYTDYLNIVGAPSGQVNRTGEVVFPIWHNTETGTYHFNNDQTHDTWLDCVQREFSTLADADLDITAELDEEAGTFSVPVNVTYALDADNLHLNLFAVVLEDGISAYQQNYFSSVGDPLLGEWSNGGIYASQFVRPFYHNDVARLPIGTSYAGTAGLLPESVKAGETVTATITSPLPNFANHGQDAAIRYAKVVVMLINADNGHVVNAARCFLSPNNYIVGIQEPLASDATAAPLYDLQGRRVSTQRPGLYIQGGKKVLIK